MPRKKLKSKKSSALMTLKQKFIRDDDTIEVLDYYFDHIVADEKIMGKTKPIQQFELEDLVMNLLDRKLDISMMEITDQRYGRHAKEQFVQGRWLIINPDRIINIVYFQDIMIGYLIISAPNDAEGIDMLRFELASE
ncbi:MAG: hypothetical protein AAF639_08625 [Chloroflexota bacterium]